MTAAGRDRPGEASGTRIDRRMLATYLNDHLAAATAGSELVRRTRQNNEGTRFGPPLAQLAEGIEQNRQALRELMATLGVRADPVKQALAWTGEKAGRLKPNNRLFSYSPLSRVIELEALSAGVVAQRSMWQSLALISDHDERLRRANLDELIDRAERQLAQLEELRPLAAEEAFARGDG